MDARNAKRAMTALHADRYWYLLLAFGRGEPVPLPLRAVKAVCNRSCSDPNAVMVILAMLSWSPEIERTPSIGTESRLWQGLGPWLRGCDHISWREYHGEARCI